MLQILKIIFIIIGWILKIFLVTKSDGLVFMKNIPKIPTLTFGHGNICIYLGQKPNNLNVFTPQMMDNENGHFAIPHIHLVEKCWKNQNLYKKVTCYLTVPTLDILYLRFQLVLAIMRKCYKPSFVKNIFMGFKG